MHQTPFSCSMVHHVLVGSGLSVCMKVKRFQIEHLPDDKILGLPKLEVFADNKLNVTQKVKAVFHRIENTVGKEENAGYQHFLLFPQCFQKAFSSRALKVVIVM